MKKSVLKLALASLLFSGSQHFNAAFAQQITYLVSDKLCTNKFDYQATSAKGLEFYDFNVYFSNTERLLLRVPKIDNMYIAKFKTLDPSATMLKCGDIEQLDAAFIEKINNSQTILYVLENDPEGGYLGYHVNEVIQLKDTESTFAYKDKRYNFTLDKRATYDKKTNLNASKLAVTLEEKGKENCFETYTFRLSAINATEAPSTFYFKEGVGLSKVSAPTGDVELKTVNGLLAPMHLKTLCDMKQVIKTPLSDKPLAEQNNKPKTELPSPKQTSPEVAQTTKPQTQQPSGRSRSLFDNKPMPAATTPQSVTPAPSTVVENPMPSQTPSVVKAAEAPKATEPVNKNPNQVQSRGLGPKSIPNPPKEVPPGYHVVKEGDNLYKIAQENFTTVNHLKYWNNLKSDAIVVNQLLKVVDDGYNDYKGANPTYLDKNGMRYIIHKVEQNDILSSISKKYKVQIKNLYEWNNLESDFLQIGQELIVGTEQL